MSSVRYGLEYNRFEVFEVFRCLFLELAFEVARLVIPFEGDRKIVSDDGEGTLRRCSHVVGVGIDSLELIQRQWDQ